MKVVLAAVGFKTRDVSFNKRKMLSVMDQYAGKADLILFGETFLQGFDSLNWAFDQDISIAVSQENALITEIRKRAAEAGIGISFGYIEREGNQLFSSQLTVGKDGRILNNYRRVSTGWKVTAADVHYAEGKGFSLFEYEGRQCTCALCGDLWHDENRDRLASLPVDIVFWPVYTDFDYRVWNTTEKIEYARQVKPIEAKVLYVNSVCLDEERKTEVEVARGGAAVFHGGMIHDEIPAGTEGCLVVDV